MSVNQDTDSSGKSNGSPTIYNGQSVNNSDDFFTKTMLTPPSNTSDNSRKPPLIKPKQIGLLLAVVFVLVLSYVLFTKTVTGGSANKVANHAVGHIIPVANSAAFKITADLTKYDKNTRINKTAISASINSAGDTHTDISVGFPSSQINSSTITRNSDKEMYLKIDGIGSFFDALGYNKTDPIRELIDKYKDTWVKFDTTELVTAAFLSQDTSSKSSTCFSSFSEYIQTKVKDINKIGGDTSAKSKLTNVSLIGTNHLTGVTGYLLDIKQDGSKEFVKQLTSEALKSNKIITINCSKNVATVPKSANILSQTIDSPTIEKPVITVDKSGKFTKYSDTVNYGFSRADVSVESSSTLLDTNKPEKIVSSTELFSTYPKYFQLFMQTWVRTQLF